MWNAGLSVGDMSARSAVWSLALSRPPLRLPPHLRLEWNALSPPVSKGLLRHAALLEQPLVAVPGGTLKCRS